MSQPGWPQDCEMNPCHHGLLTFFLSLQSLALGLTFEDDINQVSTPRIWLSVGASQEEDQIRLASGNEWFLDPFRWRGGKIFLFFFFFWECKFCFVLFCFEAYAGIKAVVLLPQLRTTGVCHCARYCQFHWTFLGCYLLEPPDFSVWRDNLCSLTIWFWSLQDSLVFKVGHKYPDEELSLSSLSLPLFPSPPSISLLLPLFPLPLSGMDSLSPLD